MSTTFGVLALEAISAYLLVLAAHSIRRWAGLGPFYALLGGLAAIMSWTTDAGVHVEIGGLTFMIGSTVFYTALLLGVFVVYVFDGPQKARIAILTVAVISILMPVTAAILHASPFANTALAIPTPDLRINVASVLTTVADLIFLAVAWEICGIQQFKVGTWLRTFLVLLGVMWLDVVLFSSGAFAGTEVYSSIMGATFITRSIIGLVAWPFLFAYIEWERQRSGEKLENRPLLAIITEAAAVREKLSRAQQEIELRKKAEAEKEQVIAELEDTLQHVRRLEGLLPICSNCQKIHVEEEEDQTGTDRWIPMEDYVREEAGIKLTHGLCPDCMHKLYPDLAERMQKQKEDTNG